MTCHPDDTPCCLLKETKPLSAHYLSGLSNPLNPVKKLASSWDNCFLWALIANKSHVVLSWSAFCLHIKIKAHTLCHCYDRDVLEMTTRRTARSWIGTNCCRWRLLLGDIFVLSFAYICYRYHFDVVTYQIRVWNFSQPWKPCRYVERNIWIVLLGGQAIAAYLRQGLLALDAYC